MILSPLSFSLLEWVCLEPLLTGNSSVVGVMHGSRKQNACVNSGLDSFIHSATWSTGRHAIIIRWRKLTRVKSRTNDDVVTPQDHTAVTSE